MQEQLFHIIFNKTANDWDTDSFLKNTIDKHPYFGLAHFYALKDILPHENSFSETAAKTALFFNNPFFLQAQLQVKEEGTLKETKVEETYVEDIPAIIQTENTILRSEEILTQEIDTATEEKDEIVVDTIQPQIQITEPIKLEKEEMLFEPLFASDYFASQGIKLSEAILNDDKLGKQLKSFTSWLKTMKKVHPDKLAPVNALVETAVQNQAAKSNIEEEILTEAMAEAFAQQGKNIRAIETFEKLSLLNPAKSAYFAAKIDSLK
jgi:hypothetical protein